MALTQRGINIPVTGQIQNGDDIVNALRALGMSTDVAIGSASIPEGAVDATDPVVANLVNSSSSDTFGALAANFVPKDQQVIDVTGHVAGDGSTDDSGNLQDIVDDLPAGGGRIYYPPGMFSRLTVPIELKGNVEIECAGKRASGFLVTEDVPAFVSANPASRIDNVRLARMRIQRTVTSTEPVLDLGGISHSALEDIDIQQNGSRSTSVGVRYGARSYYNRQVGVQVRGVNVGVLLEDEANGNRLMGNNVVLDSDYGYIIDQTNSTLLLGAAAEHVDEVGFLMRNGSRFNLAVGCRAEDIPVCYRTILGSPADTFDNFFLANLAYERNGGTRYDLPGSQVLIDATVAALLRGNGYLQRTYVRATLNSAQGSMPIDTWTKIGYDTVVTDHNGEFSGGAVTLTRSGIYYIAASARLGTTVAGTVVELAVYVNGSLRVILDRKVSPAAYSILSGGLPLLLSAGDTVEIWARSDASSVGITSGGSHTWFQIHRFA